jgi:hypothetical protein
LTRGSALEFRQAPEFVADLGRAFVLLGPHRFFELLAERGDPSRPLFRSAEHRFGPDGLLPADLSDLSDSNGGSRIGTCTQGLLRQLPNVVRAALVGSLK